MINVYVHLYSTKNVKNNNYVTNRGWQTYVHATIYNCCTMKTSLAINLHGNIIACLSSIFGAGDDIHTKKGKKNKHAGQWTLPPPTFDSVSSQNTDPRTRSQSRSPIPQNTFEIPNIDHQQQKTMEYSSSPQDYNGDNDVSIPMLEGIG